MRHPSRDVWNSHFLDDGVCHVSPPHVVQEPGPFIAEIHINLNRDRFGTTKFAARIAALGAPSDHLQGAVEPNGSSPI
jgi:hypothetical protein